MPRSANGTYTLPSASFVTQTTIVSAAVNLDLSDIAAALTQSVDYSGLTVMSGTFLAASGTAAAPGITFGFIPNTGFYFVSGTTIGYSANGTQTFTISTTGISMNATIFTDSLGNPLQAIPVGLIIGYATSVAPSLWLLCSGASVSQSTYAALFTVCGSTFGTAGVGNFLLPDLRGRAPFGKDDMGGVAAGRITNAASGIVGTTLGASGGAENITIGQSNLPNLTWTSGNVTHLHTVTAPINFIVDYTTGGGVCVAQSASTPNTGSSSTGETLASGGSGTAVATMNPLTIITYIIYAGV